MRVALETARSSSLWSRAPEAEFERGARLCMATHWYRCSWISCSGSDLQRNTWYELTYQSPSIGPNYHEWAILQASLLAPASTGFGVDKWREAYGGPRTINSGWRCPVNNGRAGGATQSRHMYGDAVDLRNQSYTQEEWDAMAAAARVAQASFIEPLTGRCGLGCVHADWRY